MNRTITTVGIGALGLALAASAVGGIAAAEGIQDLYTGSNSELGDPLRSTVPLTLHDASGASVTSGSTTTPLAAFAAAGTEIRPGDQYATLYAHLPQSGTAAGAWPGVQVSGTDRFAGSGAVSIPSSLTGHPLVRTTAAGYTLADVVAALPNHESGASHQGVYELRLRTSSPTAGVSDSYAATWVKITGGTWSITTAPVPGEVSTGPIGTSVTAVWPTQLTYGTASSVKVTVGARLGSARPSGKVTLLSGTATVSTATLSAAGTVTLSIGRTALTPGSKKLSIRYAGVSGAFSPAVSPTRSVTVARAKLAKPVLKVTTKPTSKRRGAASVSVKAPTGLSPATGTVKVTLTRGSKKVRVTGTLTRGVVKVKLPASAKGTWKVTATYAGDSRYLAATSATVTFKVTS